MLTQEENDYLTRCAGQGFPARKEECGTHQQ